MKNTELRNRRTRKILVGLGRDDQAELYE